MSLRALCCPIFTPRGLAELAGVRAKTKERAGSWVWAAHRVSRSGSAGTLKPRSVKRTKGRTKCFRLGKHSDLCQRENNKERSTPIFLKLKLLLIGRQWLIHAAQTKTSSVYWTLKVFAQTQVIMPGEDSAHTYRMRVPCNADIPGSNKTHTVTRRRSRRKRRVQQP